MFGENRFFLEIQNNGIDEQERVNAALIDMSRRLSIPLVASNDCHYLSREDVRAHDVLLCIQTGKTVHDSERLKFRTDQLYFKPASEMADYFKDTPEALAHTAEIARPLPPGVRLQDLSFPALRHPRRADAPTSSSSARPARASSGSWRASRAKNPQAGRGGSTARGWTMRSASSRRWAFRATF
ncbi:MAG: hypothetical protein MZV70_50320 [Desulfobacterales bacterium]|nr:hypothetical protein [Desulfobacterales bacterium]